jgi:hypothetical protein
MTTIAVVNSSNRVTGPDVKTMVRAVATQVRRHASPAFAAEPVPVVYLTDVSDAQPGMWVINVMNDSDQADALGWHTEKQGDLVYGRVFAAPVLDHGGGVLDGGSIGVSVASVLSHEVLETFADPHVNLWADAGDGTAVAFEICDPVESDGYLVTDSFTGTPVLVSDFVLPAWFDPNARAGDQLDWMGQVHRPFEMSKGGYVVVMREGKVDQKFGEGYPDWRRELKLADTARTARRTTLDGG